MIWSPEVWTAIATVVIAIFTIILGGVGGIQAWQTQRTIKLARDEFNATHRPKIVIHNVAALWNSTMNGEELGAYITYYNAGNADANVTKIGCLISQHPFGLRPGWIIPEDAGGLPNKPIESGAGQNLVVSPDGVCHSDILNLRAFCIGRIEYLDKAGLQRTTGFIREYSSISDSWIQIEGDTCGYEYAY